MEKVYTAQEIAEILQQEGDTDMTLRKVRHYAEIGLLPERVVINGRKRFTEEHLEFLRAARTMKKTGESLENIKGTLNSLNLDSIRNVGMQFNYYSADNLVNTETYHFNSDVSFTISNRITEITKKQIIDSVKKILETK